MGRQVLRNEVSDPVSGFFMARRHVWEAAAHALSTGGFKILFDLLASTPQPVRVAELPYRFLDRLAGESKLDRRVVIEYLSLILNKATGGAVPARVVMFALVGSTGFFVNVAAAMALEALPGPLTFWQIQFLAAFAAMTSNFLVNNAVTYFDRRKKGLVLLTAYVRFCLRCSGGLFVNVAVASFLEDRLAMPVVSSIAGAGFGAVWNYVTTTLAVW
jgi:dolichol-phosphate mannosyltransferase